jgi:CheY-like chemotaxis protein
MSKTKCAVLLIDDNEVDLFLHEQLIRHAGVFAPVWSFTNPNSALDLLASLPYTEPKTFFPIIVLLDIKMPIMDGFSFIDHFESLPPSVRNRCHIVLLSSTLQLTDSIRAEANPSVAAFVSKPLTVSSLLEVSEGILHP